MYINNQNGIISLFIVIAMVILLVFAISIYYLVESKAKIQEAENLEYRAIYSKNFEEISNIEYASENEIIPIYNIDELDIAGTNNYIQIKKKIYQCGREKSYVLKDNIIVDINEKINNKLVGFNDFKLYDSTYSIDTASFDLYYYANEKYWKTICYKKYSDYDLNIKNRTYTDNEFSILSNLNLSNESNEFLIVILDSKGEIIKEDNSTQKISRISSLEELDVYRNNKEYMQDNGEFYILIFAGDLI